MLFGVCCVSSLLAVCRLSVAVISCVVCCLSRCVFWGNCGSCVVCCVVFVVC